MLIFSTGSYADLRNELVDRLNARVGQCERKLFSDGEIYHRIDDDVAGHRAVLLGGTISEEDTLELFDMACGLVQEGVQSLIMVVPYLGYATMDRAVRVGEVVKAKTRARLISSIPHAREANRIVLLDLHSEGLQYYFEAGLNAIHVYAKPVVLPAIQALGGEKFVLGCTDAGRAKWVQSLANELDIPASFVFKRRLSTGEPVVTAVSAAVEGMPVVVYDDMIRSGASLLNAARAYIEAGATDVSCVTTHGVFPGESLEMIQASGLVSRIVATNSHPRARQLAAQHPDFLTIRSIADVLTPVLRCHQEGQI